MLVEIYFGILNSSEFKEKLDDAIHHGFAPPCALFLSAVHARYCAPAILT